MKYQTITLEVTADNLHTFFIFYDQLSPLQKEIWRYIVWCSKRMLVAQPSQIAIAKKLGCCRQAISEAFRKFRSFGWLGLTSRGWKKSKIIGIPEYLKMIDVANRQWFRRVEATHRATHNYSNKRKYTGDPNGPSKKTKEEILEVSPYLEKWGIGIQTKLKLSLLPDWCGQSAVEIAKEKAGRIKKIKNEEQYVVGIALDLAKKQGIVPNWPRYYQKIGRL